MGSEKLAYLKHEAGSGLFRKWRLYEEAKGCHAIALPELCLSMDKRPPARVVPEQTALRLPSTAAKPAPAAPAPAPAPAVAAAAAAPPQPYKAPDFVYRLLGVHDDQLKTEVSAGQKRDKPQERPLPPPFELLDMPNAMEAEGFKIAARFAKRWLEGKAYRPEIVLEEATGKEIPQFDKEHIDSQSIQLRQLLSFPAIAARHQELLKSLRTPKALERIKNIIKLNHLPPLRHWSGHFDTLETLGKDPQDLHQRFQFQFAPVGMVDTLLPLESKAWFRYAHNLGMSDVSAALGNFGLYAAIGKGQVEQYESRGTVCIPLKTPRVVIHDILVYARDTYSFDDAGASSQYLGHWNKTGLVVLPEAALGSWIMKKWDDARGTSTLLPNVQIEPGQNTVPPWPIDIGGRLAERQVFHPIRNRDFEVWRQKTGLGADFLIFSDMQRVTLPSPIVLSLT